MKIFLPIIVLAVFFIRCSETKEKENTINKDPLLGTWELYGIQDSNVFTTYNNYGPNSFYYFHKDSSLSNYIQMSSFDSLYYEKFESWRNDDSLFVRFDDTIIKHVEYEFSSSDTLVLIFEKYNNSHSDKWIFVRRAYEERELIPLIKTTMKEWSIYGK